LKGITHYPLQAENRPAKLGETRHIYLNAAKALKDLNWEPIISLQEGLRKTVDYFRTSERVA
jgi:UDP-glucose 4-epimerase